MKYLNDMKGFSWATSGNDEGFAKVCIKGQSFWIRNTEGLAGGVMSGIVDNQTGIYELDYGTFVTWTPDTETAEQEERQMFSKQMKYLRDLRDRLLRGMA